MEDTRLGHVADAVVRRTHQDAIVEVCLGRVEGTTLQTSGRDLCRNTTGVNVQCSGTSKFITERRRTQKERYLPASSNATLIMTCKIVHCNRRRANCKRLETAVNVSVVW